MNTKKIQHVFVIVTILVMTFALLCFFSACGKIGAQNSDFKVTIHPNNGNPNIIWDIRTDIPSIAKDGYHVAGYYLDSKMTISTSLESLKATGLTKNVDVYVKWEKDVCNHVEAIDNPVEPTCTETGLTQGKHCSVCGEILQAQSVIPALGHTEVIDDAIAPTCTENGKTVGKHCSVCNTIIVAQTDIAALGHDFEHHSKKDATCTEIGCNEYDTCKRVGCAYTTYQEIPALGHKYSTKWSNNETYHWHASTCGHDVVSDKERHVLDSNEACTKCSYVRVEVPGVEIRTRTLELYETTAYGKVSNDTTTFSFINEIIVADTATYIVSTDLNGSNVIRTKTVSLEIGDNTFYILVENGKELGLYTVTIRRRPIYTVSFNTNGGTFVSSQSVEEDSLAIAPTTEKKGYDFEQWDYDFSQAIIQDITVTATWTARKYTITYVLNGWTNSDLNVSTYTIENQTVVLYDALKGESLFCGWYLDAECKNHIAKIDASTVRDYVVYAYADDSATYGLSIRNGIVKGYNGTLNDVVIPSYYKGYPVTNIGDNAFNGCSSISNLTIPDSVTNIDGFAFNGCTGLTSITIPDSVTNIGEAAFSDCNSIINIYYKGNIASWCEISGLVTLMSRSRTLYVYGQKVEGDLIIPDSVTNIKDSAFAYCNGLTSVTIGSNVTTIGYAAFYYCSGLVRVLLPENITSIGISAFAGCSNLKDIVIPGNITTINKSTFSSCRGLTSITIPNSVTSIGGSAFYSCTTLENIIFKGTKAEWNAISKGTFWNLYVPSTCKVHCTDGVLEI